MFYCTKCGLCCRNVDLISELKEYDSGNGVCKFLTEENLCSIYDSRPDVCNVEKMYEVKYKFLYTREEYDRLNMKGCILLQKGELRKNRD